MKNKDIDSLSVEEMRRILKQYKELNMVPLGNIPLPPTNPPPLPKVKQNKNIPNHKHTNQYQK